MAFVIKQDVTLDPIGMGPLGPNTVVEKAQTLANLVKKTGRSWCGIRCARTVWCIPWHN